MIGLLQRVSCASVSIDGKVVAMIGAGLAVMIGIRPQDTPVSAERLLDRLLAYRVFADTSGRMNRSVTEIGGELLLVPQFTLAADTRKGLRPGFSDVAPPVMARKLFEHLVHSALQRVRPELSSIKAVQSGVFGADMQLSLVNDGPVTFWLESGG